MRTNEDRLAGLNLSENGVLDLSREYEGAPLPEHVMAAVEDSLDQGETHYTTRPGLPALARAVAQKLEREQGVTLDPSLGVIISTGGRESLFAAIQVLAQPGDEVLVPALRPAYIDEDVRLAQAVLVPVPHGGRGRLSDQGRSDSGLHDRQDPSAGSEQSGQSDRGCDSSEERWPPSPRWLKSTI